jgi:DNA ligase D-like protein (predicted ligase)
MLAETGKPFDSERHLFEIKWDGTRTMVFIDQGSYRLMNRRKVDMTSRYPEFDFLTKLPAGTVLDAEMVVLKNGKPDFALLQSRDHAQSALKIRTKSRATPATLIAFDLLYENFGSLMGLELIERRTRLEPLLRPHASARLVQSEGVIGPGIAFFEEARRLELEGVMAKRLDSRYLPGQRTDAWIKIKRGDKARCAIIGFVVSDSDPKDFRSLILAEEDETGLRYAGKVGTGWSDPLRKHINELLWARLRPKPITPCKIAGKWLEPGLYCRIRFMERTPNREFRAPVFEELFVEEG